MKKLIILVLVATASVLNAATIEVVMDRDVTVYDGYPTRTYDMTYLQMGQYQVNYPNGSWSQVYIGATLPAELMGATINSASMRMRSATYELAPSGPARVFEVTDDSWESSTIDWATMPALGTQLGSFDYEGNYATHFVDITSYLQSEVNNNDNLLSVGLDSSGNTNPYYLYSINRYFKEGWEAYAPTLIVDYTPVPEPATMILLGLGGLGTLLRKKRKV